MVRFKADDDIETLLGIMEPSDVAAVYRTETETTTAWAAMVAALALVVGADDAAQLALAGR